MPLPPAIAPVAAHAIREASQLGLPLRLVDRASALARVPAAGPVLLLFAEPRLLALVPHAAAAREQLADLFSFGDHFEVFSAFERRWQWSAALAAQLDAVIAGMPALLEPTARGRAAAPLYLYLNGRFQRKFYPALGAAPASNGTVPADNCRHATAHLPYLLRVFGPESVQNTQCDLSPDRDSWFHYSPHFDIVGIGRGTTDRQMRLGAAFEFAERWVATTRPAGTVADSAAALGPVALLPHEVWGIPQSASAAVFPGFHPDLHCEWVPAWLHTRGEHRLVPLELVSYYVDTPAPITRHRNSNGCALGNTPDEAALSGALEIIERDALLLSWYSRSTPPRLRTAGINCPTSQELLRLLAARGYHAAVFDLTTEFAIPTVLVVLAGSGDGRLGAFITAACHPNPQHAVRTALAEAKSLIATGERNYCRHRAQPGAATLTGRQDAQFMHYADPAQRRHFDFLLDAPETLDYAGFVAAHPFTTPEPEAACRQLATRIAELGRELIVCDTTPAPLRALGLHSARVYIPGTINLVFGAEPPCLPPERFHAAAAHLPWVCGIDVPTELLPHPLG